MREVFFSVQLPDGKEVCVSPVSRDLFESNSAYELGDDTGYFIYEYDSGRPSAGIEILAKAASYDAAVRLVDIYMAAVSSRAGLYADSRRRA